MRGGAAMVYHLIGFSKTVILVGRGWLFSTNRKRVYWSLLTSDSGLQLFFAPFIFTPKDQFPLIAVPLVSVSLNSAPGVFLTDNSLLLGM